ncbi:MAG: hypothetical protein HKN68_22895 [Saprospiraceae bacterium]|nr:hypothetical protein [Saprospiraceae bacterium]
MDTKKFLLAGLIGGVVYFFLGWIVYGFILGDLMVLPEGFTNIEYPEEEFRISYMIMSCLATGFFLSYIFLKWAGISTFKSGAKAGAIIGLFISFMVGTSMVSMFKFALMANTLWDMLGSAITLGIAGGVIGWFIGRK